MNNNETYTYYDKDNTPLYRVNRYYKDDKKCFYSEKFENGEWKKGLDGVERVLYKLPQVLEGIKNKEKIYFVEGEKDVETLLKKGKLATCIPGGAIQKWQDSFTASLENADVIIIADNDKIGQEFATKVADSLSRKCKYCKIVRLKKEMARPKRKRRYYRCI